MPTNDPTNNSNELAANLIRAKLEQVYQNEPDSTIEIAENKDNPGQSKHQQFMHNLANSGKSTVEIQTAWHKYYMSLSNKEKTEVWQEFYANRQNFNYSHPQLNQDPASPTVITEHIKKRGAINQLNKSKSLKSSALRTKLLAQANQGSEHLTWRHHLKSLMFGLAMGSIVIIVLLFSFFNEVIITPFIQPSTTNQATPVIVSSATISASSTPEVIIPKINVEIPVNYNVQSDSENLIENALQDGVVHFPSTVLPGQIGNAAFFGHSANNIFNPGKYKFAFVLLHDLVKGDTFYLTYNSKLYVYKVFKTEIVNPNDVSVLNSVPGHSATATLITCDPPGTSLNRLIVIGDQISPSISGDSAPSQNSSNLASQNQLTTLPNNGTSLWSRFIGTWTGKLSTAIFLAIVFWNFYRWYTKEFKAKKI